MKTWYFPPKNRIFPLRKFCNTKFSPFLVGLLMMHTHFLGYRTYFLGKQHKKPTA